MMNQEIRHARSPSWAGGSLMRGRTGYSPGRRDLGNYATTVQGGDHVANSHRAHLRVDLPGILPLVAELGHEPVEEFDLLGKADAVHERAGAAHNHDVRTIFDSGPLGPHCFEHLKVPRSLRTSRTLVIGVIVPNISNAYFTDVLRAVEDVALQAGYVVTVCSSDQDLAKERRYIDVLRNRMVDGALIAVADREQSDLRPLTESNVPVVLIDRRLDSCPDCDSVTVDTRHGAYVAVQHLIQRGYNRIGIIGGPMGVSTALDKLEGFRDALRDRGMPVDDNLIFEGDYTETSGADIGRRIFRMAEPPQAVLITNNLMTLGFFRVVKEYGLRVPHDIAFVSFDDSTWASLVSPPVTLVDQPTYQLGKTATEILLDRMDGEPNHVQAGARHRVLRPRLIIRGSC